MKLELVKQTLQEMSGPAQVCPKCGYGPIHKTHTYNTKAATPADKWRCKNTPLPGFPTSAGSSTAAAPVSVATPAAPRPQAVAAPATPRTPTPQATVVHTPGATRASSRAPSAQDLPSRIKLWLDKHDIADYTINADNSVDVAGDCRLMGIMHEDIPVKFGKVGGDFSVSGGHLISLKNCPDIVEGDFHAVHSLITSLEGMPKQVLGDVSIAHNTKLTSIEGLPSKIGGSLYAEGCIKLTSLKGIHKIVKEVGGTLDFSSSGVKEAVLGVLMIDGVTDVKLPEAKVAQIIQKHLQSADKDLHAAQEELIDAGFTAAARA